VTGDEQSRRLWVEVLNDADGEESRVLAERGRKGNFLGALQAYQRLGDRIWSQSGPLIDQLVMIVGSGTRLSPLTQALRNSKAALVLPDGDAQVLTVAEAALRSTAPCIAALRQAGFDGLVLRWGDEVLIPSSALDAPEGFYADVDAVRFGYRATPNDLLATQKEWLVSDASGTVHTELPRMPLDRLEATIARVPGAHDLYVNLGSFAASHRLLAALEEAFGPHIAEGPSAANWDPYLWMAMHSTDEDEWEHACSRGTGQRPADLQAEVAHIHDFWARAQHARRMLENLTGRPFTSKVLDFGEPYWFDAGNHAALRIGMDDLFRPGDAGDTIRALLGLPESLAQGGSHVVGSAIADGTLVRGSIVIGSRVDGPDALIDGAVLVGSRVGQLTTSPGAVVIECDVDRLVVDGPEGLAFRLSDGGHVGGDETAAGVGLPPNDVRLSHHGTSSIVDGETFRATIPGNAMSFAEAAAAVEEVDPVVLHGHWRRVRHHPDQG
jgi:hypothetical protein